MIKLANISHNFAPIFAGLFVLFAVAACSVKNFDYPSDWPELTAIENIEKRIEGSYFCLGQVRTCHGWPTGYLYNLLAIEKPSSVKCDRADFIAIENGFVLHYYDNDSTVLERRYMVVKDYLVENGWIKLKSRSSWQYGGGVTARGSIESWLTVNDEGQLTIKTKGSGVGLVLLVPAASTEIQWGKFERL